MASLEQHLCGSILDPRLRPFLTREPGVEATVSPAYNIFKLFEAAGEVDHKPQPKHERKLDSHHEVYIIGMIYT